MPNASRINFRLIPSLPELAWAAVVSRDGITIHHGSRVERGDDWCLDGAWPAPFEAGLPEGSVDALFGFMVRLRGGELWIDTPNYPLERLFLYTAAGQVFASPSLPFLLALAGKDLDSAYPFYDFDIFQISSRHAENCGSIPLAGGEKLRVIANRRVVISSHLDIRCEYRPLERSFRDFAEYREFLVRGIEATRDNAASPARRAGVYGLASGISSGYDSLALNILARPFGWKNAVTFSTETDRADSGEAVGKSIGLAVHPIDRHAYRKMPGLPEVEFLATATRAEDVVFLGAESVWKHNLVITGTFGGNMWDRDLMGVTAPEIRLINTTSSALGEFRWRAGFLHAPFPILGAMGMASLKAISHSREMQPWRLGGKYDRPIPRRIIEEFGIERGSFAAVKIGMISVAFNVPDQRLREIMNPESHAAFLEFYRRARSRRRLGDRSRRVAKYALYRAERFLGHRLLNAGAIDKAPDSFDPRHKMIPGQSSFLIPWAMETMKERYCRALQKSA